MKAKEIESKILQHYQSFEYDQAIKLMLSNKDVFSPIDFHYNLGTLFLKNKNFTVARYHLEKALSKGRIDEGVFNNLNASKMFLGVAEIESEHSFWTQKADTLYSLPVWPFVTVGLLITIAYLVVQKVNKTKNTIGFLICTLIAFLPFLIKVSFFNTANFAITFKDIELREGPAPVFEVTRTLPKGLKIVVGDPTEGWVMVKSPVEYSGWAKLSDLGVL